VGEAENKQSIQRAFDAWDAGQGGVFDLLAPDARWTIVGNSLVAGTYHGRDEFMSTVIEPFNARMATPLAHDIHGLYADGDMVIAYFDGSATARDGKPYRNTYTWYLRLADSKIVDVVAFFDSVAFNDFWTRVQPA
jgi:ketosteroid isomerase-like protein